MVVRALGLLRVVTLDGTIQIWKGRISTFFSFSLGRLFKHHRFINIFQYNLPSKSYATSADPSPQTVTHQSGSGGNLCLYFNVSTSSSL